MRGNGVGPHGGVEKLRGAFSLRAKRQSLCSLKAGEGSIILFSEVLNAVSEEVRRQMLDEAF